MSESIQCQATRRGRAWVAHIPEHGVYGYGRTLKAVRESIEAGLAHVGVTAEVTVIAVTPELKNLRSAKDAYTAALREAVVALALRSTTRRDIALATEVPTKRVKALLAERSAPPANLDPAAELPAPNLSPDLRPDTKDQR
ncbi:hypothetical protein [Nocardia terpenica]|uniref:Uncharacterized protein n=1 Tax=Nocardia terpenica TaxID=455432 RepID=A0A6G9ZED9_9NOCA|nr:hypothetical protein [Nocardia terpenica]QIS23717.1 hypothetical protein F6W96_40995 [Nocardia terpenica]